MIGKLLAFILVVYLVYKFSKFLLRTMYFIVTGNPEQEMRQPRKRQRPADGNVDIDYVPNDNGNSKTHKSSDGDYVEYEEVK